jgi:hypothetical protein
MAVTPSRIREYRRTLEDMLRSIGDDEAYREFADTLTDAQKALDEAADERGAARENRGPKFGDRVKRDDSATEPTDDTAKRPVPPQFQK